MRIQVTRTGGFAGRTTRAELDTADRIDAPHVHALAREAVAGASRTPPYGVPDGFHYAITVDGRTVHCADPGLTDPQRELISLVLHQGAVVPSPTGPVVDGTAQPGHFGEYPG